MVVSIFNINNKEVLVRVLAAPINPSDIYFIEGTYRIKPQLPGQTAGLEAAGIVEKAGRDADIPEGALVAFFYKNTWAEYVLVPAQELAVLPPDFPVERAAQFSLNPFTAWGLLDMAAPVAGEWMMLTGANSALGHIVIQLAHRKGVPVIALVRDMAQAAETKTQRADMIRQLTALIGQPSFQLPVAQIFPWQQFKKALEQNRQSGRSGKTLLKFS